MTWLKPLSLLGPHVELQPLAYNHLDDLVTSTRNGELWRLWYTTVPAPEDMSADIDRRLAFQAEGTMLPFAVIDNASGKAVGMTTYMNVDPGNRRLEIGSTWYRNSVQRTGLNTQCKLLMLTHAFEKMSCICVGFRTHFNNHQSRRSIERLGAKLDGVLRNHMRMANGTLRDTCVYSIIESEWPTTKEHLKWLLTKPREL